MSYSESLVRFEAKCKGGETLRCEQAVCGALLTGHQTQHISRSIIDAAGDAGLLPAVFLAELRKAEESGLVTDLVIHADSVTFTLP